ncbi:hypothetical protein [Candidatus Amarolinea dominans]|uniref:hypothetical protein n=1 Tax=Candidatus Amarolinea dominans TaxID=3140696 RepID=UPI00313764D1|nr:hypothetical protein [Anaerolineae bacterium]
MQEPFSWDDSVFQFLNHNVNGRNITFEEIRQGILPPAPVQANDPPLAFIVPTEQRDLLPVLQVAYGPPYPGGAVQEGIEHGWPTFSAYLVTPPGYTPTVPPAGLGGDNPWPGLLAIGGLVALFLLLALRAWRRRAPIVPPAADTPTAAVPFAMTPVATVGAAPVVALTDSEAVIPAPAAEDSTPVPALPDTLTAAPPAGDTPPAPAMIAKRLLHRRVGRYELSLTRHDLAVAESEQDAALAAAAEPEPCAAASAARHLAQTGRHPAGTGTRLPGAGLL